MSDIATFILAAAHSSLTFQVVLRTRHCITFRGHFQIPACHMRDYPERYGASIHKQE